MEELEIAMAEAEFLNRVSNWGCYSTFDGSYDPRGFNGKLDDEELQLANLEARKHMLAKKRATATNRDFDTVFGEVQLQIMVHLAGILAKTIDPVLLGLKCSVIEKGGEVCGVCQEEMENGEEARAMDCKHKFHYSCIYEWLKIKKTCPLCRYQMEVKEHELGV